MRKMAMLLSLASVFAISAYAENKLRLIVHDESGSIISDALVVVNYNAMRQDDYVDAHTDVFQALKTDHQGKASVLLSAGFYDLFVSVPGFEPICRQIKMSSTKDSEMSVKLKMSKLILSTND